MEKGRAGSALRTMPRIRLVTHNPYTINKHDTNKPSMGQVFLFIICSRS